MKTFLECSPSRRSMRREGSGNMKDYLITYFDGEHNLVKALSIRDAAHNAVEQDTGEHGEIESIELLHSI
jgi:hypothetical protein